MGRISLSETASESRQMRVQVAFHRFRQETQASIDEQRESDMLEQFRMADRVLACGDTKLRNLFHVIYVEHLGLDEWSWVWLTPRLKADFKRSIAWTPECSKRFE